MASLLRSCLCGRARRLSPVVCAAAGMFALAPAAPASFANEKTDWMRRIGGLDRDIVFSITPAQNGGVVAAGYTRSKGNGGSDIWLLALDKRGQLLWEKTYGGEGREMATAITSLADGGYAVVGMARTPERAGGDAIVLRLDKSGDVIWKKTVGGVGDDMPYAVLALKDGGLAVAGYSNSYNSAKRVDGWFFKLSKTGDIVWERTYGGVEQDWIRSIAPARNGGFALAGATQKQAGGKYGAWVLRVNRHGKLLWQRSFHNSNTVARAVVSLKGGGLAIAGWTRKNGRNGKDVWAARLNSKGKPVWQMTHGGTGEDRMDALILLPNGNLALAGGTKKSLPVLTVRYAWILQINPKGKVVSKKSYGDETDELYAIVRLDDGRLAAAGGSWRKGKSSDAWLFTVPEKDVVN